ncbi:hypothetical protein ACLKA7_012838 [Drosophila subpalustris]
MSLSVTSRRRYQTTTTTTTTTAATATVRKQHSLIEPASHAPLHAHVHGVGKYSAQQRGYLSRGLSVGRSIESIRQKLYPSPTASTVSRQSSLPIDELASRTDVRLTDPSVRLRDASLVAWSSTSSLLKTPDSGHASRLQAEQKEAQIKIDNAKADKNRINLNIVLAQTIRATNEQEALQSDTECSDLSKESSTVTTTTTTIATPVPATTEDQVSSALTVQRRPPLVRAMSAPVRLDESSHKSVLGAANKRNQQKLRRRKIFTRATSSVAVPPDPGSPLLSAEANGSSNNKKQQQLSRARSVIAPDVITLVSLLSSEGSDSEREETSSSASTPTGNEKQSTPTAQRSPQRRAPLLRKTGKSDSYPPTFQLASKEYSHMIRRGSIAPLAARIRANRPPTAPPVSIFLSQESGGKTGMQMEPRQRQSSPVEADAPNLPSDEAKKENNAANCNVQQQQDYNFPLYVCSIKERECWKLHQKMSAKGVSVSYETVLRGMLTPTEFRHFQKQREHEEAKAQEAAEAEAEAEAAAAAEKDSSKKERIPPATAIERLSESLLQSK